MNQESKMDLLRCAILKAHGCESTWDFQRSVTETHNGKVVWDGVVEVFSLDDHPKAKYAYAWKTKNERDEERIVTVLGVPPINSAQDAVRASIVADFRAGRIK